MKRRYLKMTSFKKKTIFANLMKMGQTMRIPAIAYIVFTLFAWMPLLSFGGNPLLVNAGSPQTLCLCDSVTLGGTIANPTASGGTPPYTYHWAPRTGMGSDSVTANPRVWVCTTTTFTLTVVDNVGRIAVDSVKITLDNITNVNAGQNVSICPYIGQAVLGAPGNPLSDTYKWSPSNGLSFNNVANPTVSASGLTSPVTTYTLIASDGSCSDTTTVTVTLLPPASISTVSPLTIDRGQSVQLTASGGLSYYWTPSGSLSDSIIQNPIAFPVTTTTYIVIDKNAAGCIGIDSVIVDVIPDSGLIFYNTFTPNHDGINDTWFIGNINLYPNNEVIVFNRWGSVVFQAYSYDNTWDGTSFGTNLPDATYYYVVYTGTGQEYKGAVTIIRRPQ